MIASLSGIVALRDDPYVIVDVGGVGYKVLLSYDVLSKLDAVTGKITLFTYTHVKEDVLALYGFLTLSDLKLFESLISVSGIGPKTALSIFSFGTGEQIAKAIVASDVGFFTSVPRLGKKNAQKIIIELKNKLGSIGDLDLSEKDQKEHEDVIAALKSFGFSTKEAVLAVKEIKQKDLSTQEKIRLALKYLGK